MVHKLTHKIKNTGLIVHNTTVPVMVKPLADPGPCRPASDPIIQNGGLFIQFSYDKNANLSYKFREKILLNIVSGSATLAYNYFFLYLCTKLF